MIKQFFFFLTVLISFVACSNVYNDDVNYEIITPKPTWTYYSDSPITFSTNINTDNVFWYSNKDGYLGSGNSFTLNLTPGLHSIKSILQDVEKSVSIYVTARNIKEGQTLKYRIKSSEQNLKLSEGIYKSAFIALDGSISNVSFNNNNNVELKKDIHIDVNLKSKNILKRLARSASKIVYELNDEKNFYVVNTKEQNLEPHTILSKLIKTSDICNIWYPVTPEKYSSLELDEDMLNFCVEEIEKRIIPRLKTLFGKLPDIDNDGKISILFTPTINEEHVAVGFFNPDDFYKRDNFSPFSNEMDILYIAVPEINNFSYSVKCICATIVHELTHAINYNIKTYSRFLTSVDNLPKEEIFLDEALSHLSESLCGYGISGGNVNILFHYLNNLEKYSVCKSDYLGNADSNGRRGASTMFLSWLFWKKGGISWNCNNPLEIIDEGGITFIQNLVASNGVGWENIGKIYGENTDMLYVQMIEELNSQRELQKSSILDPYSNEPVCVYPDFQTYVSKDFNKEWTLSIPLIDVESDISLVPYSFVLFSPFENKSNFQIINKNVEGQVLGVFCRE